MRKLDDETSRCKLVDLIRRDKTSLKLTKVVSIEQWKKTLGCLRWGNYTTTEVHRVYTKPLKGSLELVTNGAITTINRLINGQVGLQPLQWIVVVITLLMAGSGSHLVVCNHLDPFGMYESELRKHEQPRESSLALVALGSSFIGRDGVLCYLKVLFKHAWIFQACKICAFSAEKNPTKRQRFYRCFVFPRVSSAVFRRCSDNHEVMLNS